MSDMTRRVWCRWLGGVVSVPLLSGLSVTACGGSDAALASDDDLSHDETLQKALQAGADAGVTAGAVGFVLGMTDLDHLQWAVAGRKRLAKPTPLAAHDRMALGSCTKALTAAVAGELVASGRLTWRTRVADVLSQAATTMHPMLMQLTVEHLVNHTGGLPWISGDTDGSLLEDFQVQVVSMHPPGMSVSECRQVATRWLLQRAPVTGQLPGQSFSYSNAGYMVLAAMMEAVSGRSFEQLFEDVVVNQMGLHGRFRVDGQALADEPAGHAGAKGYLHPVAMPDKDILPWWQAWFHPAGGWSTPMASQLRWLRAHVLQFQGVNAGLPEPYWKRIRSAPAEGYEMGWQCIQGQKGRALTHTGATEGDTCLTLIPRDGRAALAAATNTRAPQGSGWVDDAFAAALSALNELP
ncbi:serine hydrolase [Hydrogenophaga sp. 5NK40-0174]|uniref:serine hydrolase domain-containing protein n=1 Tax=Hydrogenophaga sp. 5NK40-0174 TaxID=3127649 RepID=UPI003105DC7F